MRGLCFLLMGKTLIDVARVPFNLRLWNRRTVVCESNRGAEPSSLMMLEFDEFQTTSIANSN
jgi:hypothetical protein